MIDKIEIPQNKANKIFALFEIVVGKQYIGKTYTTKKKAQSFIQGNPSKGIKGNKVIFLDLNGEYGEYKTIPVDYAFGVIEDKGKNIGKVVDEKTRIPLINYIALFASPQYKKIEGRRIVMNKSDGSLFTIDEINKVLEYVLNYFTIGLLVAEDPTYYISDTPDRDITGTLARIRHRGLHVIVQYQYKSKALTPRLWNNATIIRIHKTEDNFSDYKDRLKGEREILYLAEILEKQENKKLLKNATPEQLIHVDEMPIETFYVIIHKRRTKICGAFSPNDFYQACETYILQYKKTALFEIAAEVNDEGKLKYNFKEQLKIRKEELFASYYGNKLNLSSIGE